MYKNNRIEIRNIMDKLSEATVDMAGGTPTTQGVNQPISGLGDIQGLAKFLPLITDGRLFSSAMMKVRAGQNNTLTMQEKFQLAQAFISLISDNGSDKHAVLTKLLTAHTQNTTR